MKRFICTVLVFGAMLALPALAWWPEGHSTIAEGAVLALPADVPEWFREGGALVGHMAQDPDVAKNSGTPISRAGEEPEHFIDLELLKGKPIPGNRYLFLKLCAAEGVEPKDVGTLPYSVSEGTERLAVAFAEHRKWPANASIRTKCLVYAGLLSHYSGDLCMPLHTTIHYNGRVLADGRSPRSGIHEKVDSLIERVGLTSQELAADQKIEPLPKLLPGVLEEIERSRALIDRTYELEPQLPPTSGEWKPSPEILAFTRERGRAGTRFTAALFLTAWRDSASIKLPAWLKRDAAR